MLTLTLAGLLLLALACRFRLIAKTVDALNWGLADVDPADALIGLLCLALIASVIF